MDMMEVRRRVMLSMASKSVFDKMLEVVATATVSERTREITFGGVTLADEGVYILLSDPSGNPQNAALQDSLQILCFAWIFKMNGTTKSKYLAASRKTPTPTTSYDYWGDITFTEENGSLTVLLSKSSTSPNFVPNFTYYLIRVR